ncbi:MAG: hypothetical protein QM677_09870 [Microbacterium sp.]
MSDDDLDIRSGGIVAVDTETLRAAAAQLRQIEAECDGIRDLLVRVGRLVQDAGVGRWPPAPAAVDAADRAGRLAGDLTSMADRYEVVELTAAAAVAASAGDLELATQLRRRAGAMMEADPLIIGRLAAESARWLATQAAAIGEHYGVPGVDGAALAGTTLFSLIGLGTVPRGTTVGSARAAVRVDVVSQGSAVPPGSLAEVADRVPQGDDGRVRVERYTMPDGSRRFAAYISGTVIGGSPDEAWDMESNFELYTRNDAESYEAVRAALRASGAQPGDTVTLAGHSQGAMDASFLALSGEYDVPMLVTFGDPVQADVGPETLSVALVHLDDPVTVLAAGGFAAGVGAAGSFVASRESPGGMLTGEGLLGQHALDAYGETARMLDETDDPRMDGVRERLADLAEATSVDVLVYGASDVPAPAPPGSLYGGVTAAAPGAGG